MRELGDFSIIGIKARVELPSMAPAANPRLKSATVLNEFGTADPWRRFLSENAARRVAAFHSGLRPAR
jgi:hypothetical protein